MHRFRSRVSVVLVALLFVTVLPAVFFGEPNSSPYLAYAILGVSIGGTILLLFSMSYTIDENVLSIKVGPFTYGTIKISEIRKVERSYNPLSSPAASFKRLYIRSDRSGMLISPADEQEFVRILKSKNPNIEVNISNSEMWWQFWNWDI